MAKSTATPSLRALVVPPAPEPASASAVDGMVAGRELAKRYLVDVVDVLAAIALSPQSEAALHTRMLCARTIVEIATAAPQAMPERPPPGNGSDLS